MIKTNIKIITIKYLFIIGSLFITLSVCKAQEKPDYTSKVPKFTYPVTLDAQIETLKTNPLVLRAKEYRKEFKDDPHHPIYHFTSPEGKLNDPNGLSFWNGKWHLFYQAYPREDPRQHWGHAVSEDLIQWEDLPYAIYPNPEWKCYSGATLVEDDRVIAMYHGKSLGNMVAISDDPLLLNWEKLTGTTVIPMPKKTDDVPYKIFDACVWKEGDMYYSLSGSRMPTGPAGALMRTHFLFQSKDLKKWDYLHEFIEDDDFTLVGDDGACPYFWPLGDKHILIFFSHMSGGQYLLGDYDTDRQKFIVTSHGNFNHGASTPGGVHAPSATPDGKGGVITIFNFNESKPTKGWTRMMTLPMRLTLNKNPDIYDNLIIQPVKGVESLRYGNKDFSDIIIPENEELVIKNVEGNAMEIMAEIEINDAQVIEMNVFRSPDKKEYTRLVFNKEVGYGIDPDRKIRKSIITIDESHSSIAADVTLRAPESAPFYLQKGENLKLHIFLDKSSIEVFINERQYAAVRVYPELKESTGISFVSRGKAYTVKSLKTWQMKSIWE